MSFSFVVDHNLVAYPMEGVGGPYPIFLKRGPQDLPKNVIKIFENAAFRICESLKGFKGHDPNPFV